MSCNRIQPELVAYHFAESSPTMRAEIEEHLMSCRACLNDFLTVKREIETGDEAPPESVRLATRRAVAAALAPPAPRPWSWWERPTALLCAGATVAVALAIMQAVSTGDGVRPHSLDSPPALIDEAPSP